MVRQPNGSVQEADFPTSASDQITGLAEGTTYSVAVDVELDPNQGEGVVGYWSTINVSTQRASISNSNNVSIGSVTALSLITGSSGGQELQFWPSSTTGSASSMFLLQNGSVGIGTDQTTIGASIYKLAVKGIIHAQGVVVDNLGADYVFADSYHNAPLSEVEAEIKAHHHLPGVPSAQEIAEKGANLGQMQSVLLGKIEELTLHLIEQEKTLKEQEKTVKQQEKTVKAQAERIEKLESENESNKAPE